MNATQAISLADQGLAVGEIASQLDVSPATVSVWFKRQGRKLPTMAQRRTVQLRQMAEQGMTLIEAAASLQLGLGYVTKLAKDADIEFFIPEQPLKLSKKTLLIQSLRECAEKGMTRQVAAATLGINPDYACRLARSSGFFFLRQSVPSTMTDRNIKLCAMFRDEKATLQMIGDHFGLTKERVRQILNHYGIDERFGGGSIKKDHTREEMMELFGFGLNYREIAELWDVAPATVVNAFGGVTATIRRTHKERRFWSQVDLCADIAKCWLWKGCRNNESQYGHTRWGGRSLGSHQVAFFLHNGKKWARGWVLHRCDNPPCVNPYHLYDGTPADNARDRDQRGRNGGNALRFPKQSVPSLVALRQSGVPVTELSCIFGFPPHTIRRILKKQKNKSFFC